MNGTVNPLYGGNNMNGGAALKPEKLNPVNKLLYREEKSNIEQQNQIYDAQQAANTTSQNALADQLTERATQYDSLSDKIQKGVKGTAGKSPMQAMAQNTAANLYRKTPGVDSVGKVFADVTKDIKHTSNITSDKISSIIFTVMQALSNSFTGGMNGMKAELDKISSEQEGGDDNAMVSFLADCGNFLNFFIQYSTINKQLQYKITHADDDDLLAPQQKEYIRGIKEQLEDKTEFPENKKLFGNSNTITDNLNNQIINPTTYFYDVTKNPPKWVEYSGTLDSPSNTKEEKEQIEKDRLKQRKQYLKKLNNIELEFYQEKLNNAFQYLTYTYGQLSGRTLYNLSKLLAAGGAKDVGLFAPISMGSLAGTAMRMYPGVGPALDTINDFFSSFAMAFKMSYNTLKQERNLATDYIDTTAKESNEKLRKLHTGGEAKVEYINKETFKKITSKKEYNPKDQSKNFNKRAGKIVTGPHTPAVHVPEFSKVRAERDLKLLNEILSDYYHVISLMKLIKIIGGEGKSKDSIYIGKNQKDDKPLKLQKITSYELKVFDNKLKGKFSDLYSQLDGTINQSESHTLSDENKNSIELNNPVLYGIVKEFIKTTSENLGQEAAKEAEEEEEEVEEASPPKPPPPKEENEAKIKKSLVELINKLKPTNDNNEQSDSDKIDNFLNKQEESKKKEEDKSKQTEDQIKELISNLHEETNRIKSTQNTGRTTDQDTTKNKAGTDIPSSIEKYKKIIERNLKHYNNELLDKISAEIVASNSFKPLKKLVSSYQKLLKSGVKKIIDDFKAEYNKDAKNDEKNKQLIYRAFDKLLKFIDIKNFEAVNNGLDKIEHFAKYVTKKNGGSMRSSTIKRRIKKATRRIQLSLDEFNSGRNTRRGRYRKKPHKTRRVNYGH